MKKFFMAALIAFMAVSAFALPAGTWTDEGDGSWALMSGSSTDPQIVILVDVYRNRNPYITWSPVTGKTALADIQAVKAALSGKTTLFSTGIVRVVFFGDTMREYVVNADGSVYSLNR